MFPAIHPATLRNPDILRTHLPRSLALLLALASTAVHAAGTDRVRLQQTDWRPASSMIAASDRGGIVVVPLAAIAAANDGTTQVLHQPGALVDVALPPADPIALLQNTLSIQITADPVDTLPQGAIVTGIEVALALGADEIAPTGKRVNQRSAGFSVVDASFVIADTANEVESGSRGKQANIGSSTSGPFAVETYGGNQDLWATPAMPTVAAYYRGNSLVMHLLVRNAGDRSAILAVDHFRFRLHYQLPPAAAKATIANTSSPAFGALDPTPCYSAPEVAKASCDAQLAQHAAHDCLANPSACIDRAAKALEWARSGAGVDAYHRAQAASRSGR